MGSDSCLHRLRRKPRSIACRHSSWSLPACLPVPMLARLGGSVRPELRRIYVFPDRRRYPAYAVLLCIYGIGDGMDWSRKTATDHDWHGGPPMMQSTRPRNSGSVSRSETISPSCMASASSGRLSLHASAASRSNSFAHMHSNPALSNPTSSPPAPENRETVVSFLESLAMFDISPVDVRIFVSPTVQFPCDGH